MQDYESFFDLLIHSGGAILNQDASLIFSTIGRLTVSKILFSILKAKTRFKENVHSKTK
jgi:hypothetical protein